MKIRTSEYFFREVFRSLHRHNWMALASILTVAVSMFVFGLFFIMAMNMNRMAETIESQVEISVYLKDDVTLDKARKLERDFGQLYGVRSVTFISKDVALTQFRERLGDQRKLLDALGDDNPLPNSFEIVMQEPDMVQNVAREIETYEGVEAAKYGQGVVEHLFDITRMLRAFGIAILVVLAGSSLFIIVNTIRLTVFARRKEIAIMKYVGATDWFIRWPFMLEGMVLGLIGGAIAVGILRVGYAAAVDKIYSMLAFFPLIPEYPFIDYVSIGILVGGMIFGAIGSTISLKRFLNV